MFHVTPATNLPAILATGLVPQIGERAQELGEPEPRVYAFASLLDCRDGLCVWLGNWFNDQEQREGKEIPLVVLEIDPAQVPSENIEQDVLWEVAITKTVPPEAIVWVWSEIGIGHAEAFSLAN